MKKNIFCYLLFIFTILNFNNINAEKNKPKPKKLNATPVAVGVAPKLKRPRKKSEIVFPATATPEEILRIAYQKTATLKCVRSKNPILAKLKKSALLESISSTYTSPTDEDVSAASSLYLPTTAQMVDLPGTELLKNYFQGMFTDTEVDPTPKSRYCHDAYATLTTFRTKWEKFQEYFEKLIQITDYRKYFSKEAQESTKQINEKFRSRMTPSSFLSKAEGKLLYENPFNSQTVSEILSKKLSELGFENYIMQFTPGYKNPLGFPEGGNNIRWVVLYRGYMGNWFIADFSLAMEHKYNLSAPQYNEIAIPFAVYMTPLLNFARYPCGSWNATFEKQEFKNAVMINLMPGFYDKSDKYYFSDLAYIPLEAFIEFKLEIEEEEGGSQCVDEIKSWLDTIRETPNYKSLVLPEETLYRMHEYMINYLVVT